MFKLSKIVIILLSLLLISCSDEEKSSLGGEQSKEKIKKVRWKMASTFPGSLTQLGTAGIRLQDQIAKVSGNNIKIKFF